MEEDVLGIGKPPRIEDCPWFTREDQFILDNLYKLYYAWNVDAVLIEEVDDSLEYDLVYIPDTGVTDRFLGQLVKHCGYVELWRPIIIGVNIDSSIGQENNFQPFDQIGFWNDNSGLRGFCAVMNYGKSWRLLPKAQKQWKQ